MMLPVVPRLEPAGSNVHVERAMACIQKRVIRDVIAVGESVSCAEAARVMGQFGIGCVGVRRGEQLLGVVTARDLLGCLTGAADAHHTPVAAALRPDMPAVSAKASDQECARLMRCHRTGHLAVEEGGRIVGVISLLDLCDIVVEDREWSIKQLQSFIRGGRGKQLPRSTTIFKPGGLRRACAAQRLDG